MNARRKFGLSIGEVAARTGLKVTAIRFYADQGLVHPERNPAGTRRFHRADIRRISFIMIAQGLGFSLADIRMELDNLPRNRAPTQADWTRASTGFRKRIEARIAALEELKDKLDNCIGCGCLSLDTCALYNPADRAAMRGTGPRYLLGDRPET